jgi:glycosyltransferase involved in cell wall biosynthesis
VGLPLLPWHARFEARIYAEAQLVLHAIPAHARYAFERYPKASSETLVNGYPPELEDKWQESPPSNDGRLRVCSVGVSCPVVTVQLARALRALRGLGIDADFVLVGRPPSSVNELATILGDRLIATGPVPHPTALEHMSRSHVLVSAVSLQRSRCMLLSSRLFEYLATNAPIVVVNPTEPDRELLRGRARTFWATEPSPATLVELLREASVAARSGPLDAPRIPIDFSRRYQVRRLAQLLDQIVR